MYIQQDQADFCHPCCLQPQRPRSGCPGAVEAPLPTSRLYPSDAGGWSLGVPGLGISAPSFEKVLICVL